MLLTFKLAQRKNPAGLDDRISMLTRSNGKNLARVNFQVKLIEHHIAIVRGGKIFHLDNRLSSRLLGHLHSQVVVNQRENPVRDRDQNNSANHGASGRLSHRRGAGAGL